MSGGEWVVLLIFLSVFGFLGSTAEEAGNIDLFAPSSWPIGVTFLEVVS